MTAAFVEYNSKAAVFVFRQILCLYKNTQRIAAVKKFKHLSNDFVSFDGFIITFKCEPVMF